MFDAIFPKHWTTLQRLMWLKTNALARAVYETITGNPVTFTAKAAPLRKLEVAFSPVQDLHGYDSPWPAGGGKNLIPDGTDTDNGYVLNRYLRNNGEVSTSSNWYVSEYFSVTAGADYTISTNASSPTNPSICFYDSNKEYISGVAYGSQNLPFSITAPENAAYARASQGTNFATHGTQIEAGSPASSITPYRNICPISGWSSLTVEQRGKNLFDAEHPEKDGYYNVDGTYNSASGYSCYLVPAKAEQKYTCQGNFAGIKTFWDKDLNFISGINQGGGATKTFATPAGTAYFRISIAKSNIDGTQQIEFGETASEVVPYNPSSRSISISLGETVYSGWVDAVTGVLTVTHKRILLGDFAWQKLSDGKYRVTNGITDMKTWGSYYHALSWWCNIFKVGTTNANPQSDCEITTTINSGVIRVRYDAIQDDAAAFKTFLQEHNAELVYELAEPIPIQLTPQEVQSLAGDNTMWTDGDSLTVEYRSN